MKKILAIASLSLAPLMFTACGESSSNYVGYWQGEANMIFEVLTSTVTCRLPFRAAHSAARTRWIWNT